GRDPDAAAVRLAELAQHLGRRRPESLDPAIDMLRHDAEELAPALLEALVARVVTDPAATGFLVSLGRVAERSGVPAVARVAYGLLGFVDPQFPIAERLAALGVAAARPGSLEPGAADHPFRAGPLRRVLTALAPALAIDPGAPATSATLPGSAL